MQAANKPSRPWYVHPWPWLLMLGPALVVAAGVHATLLAFRHQDALVVGDYYKEGKAINQDLRRERAAAALGVWVELRYDPAAGRLYGRSAAAGQPLRLKLVHPTQPEKDLELALQPDGGGAFAAPLALLETARWQVLLENAGRDWRLSGDWSWPRQSSRLLRAGQENTGGQ